MMDRDLIYLGTSYAGAVDGPGSEIMQSHARWFNRVIYIGQGEVNKTNVCNDGVSFVSIKGYKSNIISVLFFIVRIPYLYYILWHLLKESKNPLVYFAVPSPFALTMIPLVKLLRIENFPIVKGVWADNLKTKFAIARKFDLGNRLEKILITFINRHKIVVVAGSQLAKNYSGISYTHIWRGTTHNKTSAVRSGTKGHIAFAGRLDQQKRCEDLIRALYHIHENTRMSLGLTVIGDGPKLDDLKKLSKALRLDKYITFKGWLKDRRQIFEIFDESDVLVLCSDSEGTPKVIPEALSRGCVVIATKVGDIPNMLKHGTNSLLYEPTRIDELAMNLKLIFDDEHILNTLRLNGKKYADENTLDSQVNKLWSSYVRINQNDL